MIHLFGALTPAGLALQELAGKDLVGYSRNPSPHHDWIKPVDFKEPGIFHPAHCGDSMSIWISFAPIWLFAPFLKHLWTYHPERLQGLRAVIACSSSSSITKRFAFNRFDRDLVGRLTQGEDMLLSMCKHQSLPCRILQPTLIYGKVGDVGDRNLSRLGQFLRRFPVLPLPAESGLRQPIHASQLAAVAFHLSKQLSGPVLDPCLPERIPVGGDTTLTYAQMIGALQQALYPSDPARRCRLILIPNRLFFFLIAPLLLPSPKAFEAFLRMGANLSGFTPAHQILGSEAQPFPVLPLT